MADVMTAIINFVHFQAELMITHTSDLNLIAVVLKDGSHMPVLSLPLLSLTPM